MGGGLACWWSPVELLARGDGSRTGGEARGSVEGARRGGAREGAALPGSDAGGCRGAQGSMEGGGLMDWSGGENEVELGLWWLVGWGSRAG